MEGKNRTIQKTLNMIEDQSLKRLPKEIDINPLFKENTSNYLYINNLPSIIIKCDLVVMKTKFDPKCIMLKNIQFPRCFIQFYEAVLNKYYEEIEIKNSKEIDNSFGNSDELVLFPKNKSSCENIESGNYKVNLRFGSIHEDRDKDFKIIFYINSLEKINDIENVIDEFESIDVTDYLIYILLFILILVSLLVNGIVFIPS